MSAQPETPLLVAAQITEKGPFYVGQSIPLRVITIAARQRPTLVPPQGGDAPLTLVGTSLEPISTTGIGNFVTETNRFLYQFRVVPRHAGIVTIPPVVLRLDDRKGSSRAIRLNVKELPADSRPAEFLGGVGTFSLESQLNATTVRRGTPVEYRLRVSGTAARTINRSPEFPRRGRVASDLQIAFVTAESVADPPSRTFVFRVRPLQAGKFTLPPLTIAAFDPKIGRYVSKASASVSLQVVDVPAFNPAQLDYRAVPTAGPAQQRWLAAVVTLGLLSTMAVYRAQRSRARTAPDRARRKAIAQAIQSLRSALTSADAARRVVDGLTDFLETAAGRPRGALTPCEAREGILRATGDTPLSERAYELVARCDQCRFAGRPGSDQDLIRSATEFFEALGKAGASAEDETKEP